MQNFSKCTKLILLILETSPRSCNSKKVGDLRTGQGTAADSQTARQTDRNCGGQADRQTDRKCDVQTDNQTSWQTDRKCDG